MELEHGDRRQAAFLRWHEQRSGQLFETPGDLTRAGVGFREASVVVDQVRERRIQIAGRSDRRKQRLDRDLRVILRDPPRTRMHRRLNWEPIPFMRLVKVADSAPI